MSAKPPFYITTTLPYVNSDPHIGFALEIIRADAVARFKESQGFDVFFNTGTDEHGAKIFQRAKEEGIDPQAFVDRAAKQYTDLLPRLGILPEVNFIRTTDGHHVKAAQEFWKRCDANGFIYKKDYEIKYCVGCELEKTESELVDGKCPLHPNLTIEIIKEQNYFFKFSEFQHKLLEFYDKRRDFVIPDFRYNEIRSFVSRGLADFSISRLKEKMPWGIEVPGDPEQVMYVWFDALVNYISAIGWPDEIERFERWQKRTGGMVQYCGKDNLRQQAAMWQAMLMAAGLPNSQTIVIDGFVTGAGGIKMSKSLGNTIDPVELVNEYGTDALRYYVLREASPFEDSPFTKESFKEAYNAGLANGLGNLVSRVMTMAENNLDKPVDTSTFSQSEYEHAFEKFNLQEATNVIWQKIAVMDAKIQNSQPFKLVKTDKTKAIVIIEDLVKDLSAIGQLLQPLLPETSEKILALIKTNKKPATPLFVRKD
ncbi:MAG: methionine--tRNA ligase [Patescibacteria group bacterium]|nr:methionine--tRNA ligase [Patescibacteria group bacterium]MDE1945788.1 methionine--tRNA ligase [Patescibacteria group bacterium]